MSAPTFGPYRLLSELGRGGMGVVYRAHDSTLQRFVALKTLAGPLARDEDVRERFLREARSMASLADPHVVTVYSCGEEQGQPYFTMELVDGEPLSALFKRQVRLSAADAARLIHQAALGLGAAHARGIVHRDVKPGNLLLTRQGTVKVADFGIARSLQQKGRALTLTGEFVGTPGYLSPEACTGQTADARSDVFSLGMVLFECLTGRVPFATDSPLALLLGVVQDALPDVRALNAEADEVLLAVLQRMVAKNPDGRYANGLAVADALAQHPAVTGAQPLAVAVRAAPTRPLPGVPPPPAVDAPPTRVARPSKPHWSYPAAPTAPAPRRWWPWLLVGLAVSLALAAPLVLHG